MARTRRVQTQLRRTVLATALLVLAQAAIGMIVNLRVSVPSSHPGAQPSNYFSGSFKSVMWAIGHGPAWLAIHATLGLALVALVIADHGAARSGRRRLLCGCAVHRD